MKYLSLGVVLLASAVGVTAQTPADKANDKITKGPITLTGCVEPGKEANTFILTHVVRADSTTGMTMPSGMPQPSISNPAVTPPIVPPTEPPPATQPSTTPATEPAPTGTSGVPSDAAAIYWLDPPDKLKPHVGHKVSVTGTLDDDMDKAKIKTTDDKTKIEAERGSRKVEAKPGTTAAAEAQAAKSGDKQESYKVKVTSVKMISSSCS